MRDLHGFEHGSVLAIGFKGSLIRVFGELLGDIEPHLLLLPLLLQLNLLFESADGVLLVVYFFEIFQILLLLVRECGKHEVELFLELVIAGLQL